MFDYYLPILAIIFLATLTQGLAGFGSALISMPLLIPIVGIEVATPLYAVVLLALELIILFRYRSEFRWSEIWRLALASCIGIPFGVVAIHYVDENLVQIILGILVIGYALYSLLGPELPKLANLRWEYPFGLASGILSGMFNTSGPPYVVYGTMTRWEPIQFKLNLQFLFLITSIITTAMHTLTGHMTPEVVSLLVISIPVSLLAGYCTIRLDSYIQPEPFRKGVLILLLVLGLTLLL